MALPFLLNPSKQYAGNIVVGEERPVKRNQNKEQIVEIVKQKKSQLQQLLRKEPLENLEYSMEEYKKTKETPFFIRGITAGLLEETDILNAFERAIKNKKNQKKIEDIFSKKEEDVTSMKNTNINNLATPKQRKIKEKTKEVSEIKSILKEISTDEIENIINDYKEEKKKTDEAKKLSNPEESESSESQEKWTWEEKIKLLKDTLTYFKIQQYLKGAEGAEGAEKLGISREELDQIREKKKEKQEEDERGQKRLTLEKNLEDTPLEELNFSLADLKGKALDPEFMETDKKIPTNELNNADTIEVYEDIILKKQGTGNNLQMENEIKHKEYKERMEKYKKDRQKKQEAANELKSLLMDQSVKGLEVILDDLKIIASTIEAREEDAVRLKSDLNYSETIAIYKGAIKIKREKNLEGNLRTAPLEKILKMANEILLHPQELNELNNKNHSLKSMEKEQVTWQSLLLVSLK